LIFTPAHVVHFANAPIVMLFSAPDGAGIEPSLLIAACIVLPQVIVALASPSGVDRGTLRRASC